MAVGADALTTWARAKSILGYADDMQTGVEFLIDAVSVCANKITGRRLASRTFTNLLLDGSGTGELVLPEFPVASFTSLYIDTARAFGASTLIASTEYDILTDAGIVRLFSGVFPRGYSVIKITAALGYTPIPYDLELAVLDCVAWNKKRVASEIFGVKAITTDQQVTSQYEIDIPLSARSVFELYKRGLA